MIQDFRRALCFCLFTGLLANSSVIAKAQVRSNVSMRVATDGHTKTPQLPEINTGDFRSLVLPIFRPTFRYDLLQAPAILPTDVGALLENAIAKRLGVRYRYYGANDHGYDCSGFVWSVFKEAGADFERGAARALWYQLPEAVGSETGQFGTLVFFNGLKHVGIVRDAESFYHSSRSRGVTLSLFSSYWKRRITGFRRSPTPVFPLPPDSIRPSE